METIFPSFFTQNECPVLNIDMPSFNDLIGTKGLPINSIIDIYGSESAGKTAYVLHMIAEMQRKNHLIAYIDADHKLNYEYMEKEGIDIENLVVFNNNIGEEIIQFVKEMLKQKVFNLIVIDSLSSIISKNELDQPMDVYQKQTILNQVVKEIAGAVQNTNCTIIFISQLRSNKNIEVEVGKNAFNLYSSISIEMHKEDDLYDKEVKIGERLKLYTTKNKINTPFKQSFYDIIY